MRNSINPNYCITNNNDIITNGTSNIQLNIETEMNMNNYNTYNQNNTENIIIKDSNKETIFFNENNDNEANNNPAEVIIEKKDDTKLNKLDNFKQHQQNLNKNCSRENFELYNNTNIHHLDSHESIVNSFYRQNKPDTNIEDSINNNIKGRLSFLSVRKCLEIQPKRFSIKTDNKNPCINVPKDCKCFNSSYLYFIKFKFYNKIKFPLMMRISKIF